MVATQAKLSMAASSPSVSLFAGHSLGLQGFVLHCNYGESLFGRGLLAVRLPVTTLHLLESTCMRCDSGLKLPVFVPLIRS